MAFNKSVQHRRWNYEDNPLIKYIMWVIWKLNHQFSSVHLEQERDSKWTLEKVSLQQSYSLDNNITSRMQCFNNQILPFLKLHDRNVMQSIWSCTSFICNEPNLLMLLGEKKSVNIALNWKWEWSILGVGKSPDTKRIQDKILNNP